MTTSSQPGRFWLPGLAGVDVYDLLGTDFRSNLDLNTLRRYADEVAVILSRDTACQYPYTSPDISKLQQTLKRGDALQRYYKAPVLWNSWKIRENGHIVQPEKGNFYNMHESRLGAGHSCRDQRLQKLGSGARLVQTLIAACFFSCLLIGLRELVVVSYSDTLSMIDNIADGRWPSVELITTIGEYTALFAAGVAVAVGLEIWDWWFNSGSTATQ